MRLKGIWPLFALWSIFVVVAFSVLARAAPGSEPVLDAPSISEWLSLYHALGELKGMSTLGAVAVVVQALLLAARSQFDPLPNAVKLMVVTGLTIVLGIVGMKTTTSVSWTAAMLHATTLSSFQVFLNQVYKSLFVPQLTAPVVAASAPVQTQPPKAS